MIIYIKEHTFEMHYAIVRPLVFSMLFSLLKLRDFIVPFICFVKHWKNVIKSEFSSTKCEAFQQKKTPSHPGKNLFKKKTSLIIIIIFL
jgi:hypothetical protein